jgi:hypothetical protein
MPEEKQPAAATKPKGKKTAVLVLAILLVEAVVIVGAMKFLGGHAAPTSAVEMPAPSAESEDDKIVETLVLNAKMPNNKSGVTYIYATEIYVQVKQRHLERVKSEIEQFQNELKADITAIWRTAEPQHFQEPKLDTLTRKVYALLNDRFGEDKVHKEPIVSKVVIVMSTGFRVDN